MIAMKITIFGTEREITAASTTGQRSENQDSVGWIAMTKNGTRGEIVDGKVIKNNTHSENEILFCILCDGMGGLEDGKAMSEAVVTESLSWVQKRKFDEPKDVFMGYRNYLHDLEKELMGKYPNSGTTVAVLFAYQNEWFSMHLGDSRIYTIHRGNIERTRDHSPVEELFRSGVISEDEMNDHPMKNMISSYVGGGKVSNLTFSELGNFDKAVVCSDGAYGYMSIEAFERLITSSDTADEIIAEAFSKGSKDNISAIVVNNTRRENRHRP